MKLATAGPKVTGSGQCVFKIVNVCSLAFQLSVRRGWLYSVPSGTRVTHTGLSHTHPHTE